MIQHEKNKIMLEREGKQAWNQREYKTLLLIKDYLENAQKGWMIMEERAMKIVEACLKEMSKNPIEIFRKISQKQPIFILLNGIH